MRLVLDTNIVMDMLHFDDPRTQPLKAALQSGRAQCFSDTGCLAELERVAGYPAFALNADEQAALLSNYRTLAKHCEGQPEENYPLPRCRDADDQKFLILAARCRADVLVTRDNLLLCLARHRRLPPPFAILTAEAASGLLQAPPENPAPMT